MSLLLVLSLACTKQTDDSSGGETATETHPNIPEGYELKMNYGEGCNDGADTAAYIIGQGSTDAEGNFTGTETWYWFFGGAWEDDCIDTWQMTGEPVGYSVHQIQPADEGYYGDYTKIEPNGCPGQNYLYIWDSEDEDWHGDFEYGDLPTVQFLSAFDTITPGGNVNEGNKFIFFHHILDGYTVKWADISYDTQAVITPSGDEHGPPATYSWFHSFCFDG